MATAWAIVSYLLGGILAWGGIGWVIDRLAHTGKAFMATGMVLGVVGGIYLVYRRYGREPVAGGNGSSR
jgi:F0F1-type ATP synthase assembly protein I